MSPDRQDRFKDAVTGSSATVYPSPGLDTDPRLDRAIIGVINVATLLRSRRACPATRGLALEQLAQSLNMETPLRLDDIRALITDRRDRLTDLLDALREIEWRE